jgi:hypothetical protein
MELKLITDHLDKPHEVSLQHSTASNKNLLFPKFAQAITGLSQEQLCGRAPLDPALRLFSDNNLEGWYTPFEHINFDAKIVLVGITPGRTQLLNGLREANVQLRLGNDHAHVLCAAKQTGAFSGPLREHLVALLNHVGFQHWLGLKSTNELFGKAQHLLHTSSVLRHAVMYKGENYNGMPNMLRQPILRKHLLEHFANEASMLRTAVFVPLGDKAAMALEFLAAEGILRKDQIFDGLPHPSPANIERIQYFTGQKDRSVISRKVVPQKLDAARERLQHQLRELAGHS